MRIRGAGILVFVIGVANLAVRADAPDPKEILTAADAAAKALKAVTYEGEVFGEGAQKLQVPRIRGRVTMAPTERGATPRIRVDGATAAPGATEFVRFELGSDASAVTLIEHGRKKYAREPMPRGMALLDRVGPLLMSEFASAAPFADELKGKAVRYVGREQVGQTECEVVDVEYGDDGGSTARWYFGREDHLPRRVDRTMHLPQRSPTITLTISKLELNPKVDDAVFKLAVPEGYDADGGAKPQPRRPPGKLIAAGEEAPGWTLRTIDGSEVKLKDLRGKVVVLDFWATWCTWCIRAMPDVQKIHERFKDKPVAVFGVNCQERDPAKPRDFIRKNPHPYPQLLNGDGVAQEYGVTGIPVIVVIGPNGGVAYVQRGYSPVLEAKLTEVIEAALPKP
jgi:thiol-disulfide isomerase/thioredoxin